MTTKFLDNKICKFKILLSWRFPRKKAFWTIFLSAPKPPPLKKRKVYFYCRLAVSDFGRRMAHSPPSCPDASKKWVSIGIYRNNRPSNCLWLETEEAPQNSGKVIGGVLGSE